MHVSTLAVIVTIILAALTCLFMRKYFQSPKIDGSLRHIKTVVITGGANGIGYETAKCLIAAGIQTLILIDVNEVKLREATAQLKTISQATRILAYACDVANPTHVAETCRKILDAGHQVDVFVSNAGVVVDRDTADTAPEVLQRCFGVNVFASFYFLTHLLPGMKERKHGCIVLVSSVMGWVGSAQLAAYVSSKYALRGVGDCLRMELSRDKLSAHIPVITFCPYATRTEMFAGVFEDPRAWNPVRDLLFPMLLPQAVALKVVDAINRWKNDVRVTPRILLYLHAMLQCLPLWFSDYVNGAFGGWHGMSSFRGKAITATLTAPT